MIKQVLKNLTLVLILIVFHAEMAWALQMSPNGYSGVGLVPSTETLSAGTAVLSFDPSVPGAKINKGYNTQVGLGLTDNLELVGRLATNNQNCNLFKPGDCPNNSYRDFSSSMKLGIPSNWLKENAVSVALGVTDFGGAATYFRSYYLVGSKSFNQLELTIGQAAAKVPSSILNGTFASATWKLFDGGQVSLQKIGQNTSIHLAAQRAINDSGTNISVTFNHRVSNTPITEKKWIGWGISFPLDAVEKKSTISNAQNNSDKETTKRLRPGSNLKEALVESGFYSPMISTKKDGTLVLELENVTYAWNVLDAAGVALGLVASSSLSENKNQNFELTITSRGIKQIKVSGEATCVGKWLETGEPCNQLKVQSMLQRQSNGVSRLALAMSDLKSDDEVTSNSSELVWRFRPEIIVSPALVSSIGTEYGSFDFDMGANINAVLPLWAGATLENNRLEPLGVGSKQFEQGGVFYGARIKPTTNRKLFHQLINLPEINTQARLSVGTAYSVWEGRQIETSSQTDDGRHKFGITSGSFQSAGVPIPSERNYRLINYRFANNDQQTAASELTSGKFWAGDKGFSVNQRFWYGDTVLNLYFRRTRMTESQPLVSFAGLQFSIPFTPRENKSLEHLGFRGVSQWTYSIETKVLEKDNIITGGYGEVPRIGDSLVTTFNRDRNSTRYYENNLVRMRNAYLNLGAN